MRRFDNRGMMVIPNPQQMAGPPEKEVIVVKDVYCPNGHDLVSRRALFGKHGGILLDICQGNQSGSVALSPIFGEKIRVTLDIDLVGHEMLEMFCPQCQVELPVYALCDCGGRLTALFLTPDADFADCLGLCNRVDCHNAQIIASGDLVTLTQEDQMQGRG